MFSHCFSINIPVLNPLLPGLKFVHINCRSLVKNLDQIIEYFSYCDIVCCSETWLKPEILSLLVFFPGKELFRLDRSIENGKIRGGGVCIYVSDKLSPFVEINSECTYTSKDFEMLTINISKPNMRFMLVSSLYKPPTGKNKECIDFLKKIYKGTRREIWLLGDFNVDLLDRTSDVRLKYINVFKVAGIRQLISKYTRPNAKGGTCLDWITTNSDFVNSAGTLDMFISDHLPVYCIRKKPRERHSFVFRSLEVFAQLLKSLNWELYNTMLDVDMMWDFLYEGMHDILAIMCPFRKFKQRKKVTAWLTADIYRAMRVRDS